MCKTSHAIDKSLTFTGNSMSDFEASYQLNHTKPDQSTYIATIDGADLFLFGCTTILTPSGQFLYGKGIAHICEALPEIDKETLFRFLQGEDVPALKAYQVTSNPYFGFEERDGTAIGEPFSDIPADVTQLSPDKA